MNLLRFKKDDPTYGFLSNYYPCSFVLDGIYYLNAEAAFQAQKVPPEERRQFACLMPNRASERLFRVRLCERAETSKRAYGRVGDLLSVEDKTTLGP